MSESSFVTKTAKKRYIQIKGVKSFYNRVKLKYVTYFRRSDSRTGHGTSGRLTQERINY